jgi:hypothetical protein
LELSSIGYFQSNSHVQPQANNPFMMLKTADCIIVNPKFKKATISRTLTNKVNERNFAGSNQWI